MKRKLLTAFLTYVLILFSMVAQAQTKRNLNPQGDPHLNGVAAQQPSIDKSVSKLHPDLQKLYDETVAKTNKAAKAQPLVSNGLDKYLQVRDGKVIVDITVKGNADKTTAELEKSGFKVSAVFGRVISGTIPINALPQLETIPDIRFAKPSYKPMHQTQHVHLSDKTNSFYAPPIIKPVISQGDTAQRSNIAKEKYHVKGEGVKVGILSDSYNNLETAETGVKQGELPGPGNPFRYITPVQVLEDLESGGTDEGRGMAEIVHDVAPASTLAFHTAFNGEADFAQGILDLASAGCKVINDDVFYYDEPFFQDGIVAQAVNQVKQAGVTYFSSAGNNSNYSYESNYRPGKFAPFGPDYGTAHNFSAPKDPPRYFEPIYIPTNGKIIVSFQWDQPFYSAGGAGATSDLDIYLLDSKGSIVAGSASDNILSGDPIELFGYLNKTKNTTFYILILKYKGPDPTRLKHIDYGNSDFYKTTPEIPGTYTPTLVGHAKAEGAIATAAAAFFLTPAYGVNPPEVEYFSSLGGVATYFDPKGRRIGPIVRKKPEITAPDGGNTSFFPPAVFYGNQDIPQDPDTYPNFFGTSAAAPHAAGVAALMISAHKHGILSPDQIKNALETNTIDMDNIYLPGFQTGFDFNTGYGLISADVAVGAVANSGRDERTIPTEIVGSNAIDHLNPIGVYPNPSPSNFRVYLPTANSQNTNIELYNSEGKKLLSKSFSPAAFIDIDAGGYRPGVYFLKVRQGDVTKTFKLIKQ